MLELEKLTQQTFLDMIDQAVKSIGRMDTSWNNLQPQDPGMTMVDLFAWLEAMQHEYMSQILPESQARFLSLLDVTPKEKQAATAFICLEGIEKDGFLPGEYRLGVGGLSFENPVGFWYFAAQLRSAVFGGKQVSLSEMDGIRRYLLFSEELAGNAPSFTLYFDRPLPSGKPVSLYFSVVEAPGRNPVRSAIFEPLSRLSCEVWSAEGWAPAEILRDDSHGFLFSGRMELCHTTEMEGQPEGFAVRFTLLEDGYDLPPACFRIFCNVCPVVQQETLCRTDLVESGDTLPFFLHLFGTHRVFMEEQDGWRETDQYFLMPSSEGMVLLLPRKCKALVLSCEQDERLPVLGSGHGFSGQRLYFPWKKASQLTLLIGERKGEDTLWKCWERRTDLYSSDMEDRHFILHTGDERISFGDHQHGMAPRAGIDNILLSSLKLTEGLGGNIKNGQIRSFRDRRGLPEGLTIRQITPASGGTDGEGQEEAAARLLESLHAQTAVTEGDYLRAVRETEGLLIENCRVLSGFDGALDHRITVVVQGGGRAQRTHEGYRRNIMRNLDQKRLLTSQIQVRWPVVVRLNIGGQITVHAHYPRAQEMVLEKIKAFLAERNQSFGTTFSYGDFYCALDLLECVSMIESLSVEPQGGYLQKTQTDDILLPPGGICELGTVEIRYLTGRG